MSTLPADSQERKDIPVMRGVIDYFPDAIADVARLSLTGNQKHNPEEDLHHARDKSTDHADCIIRHLIDRGTVDDDGIRHSTKVAWRALALAQEEIEADEGLPLPRGARLGPKAHYGQSIGDMLAKNAADLYGEDPEYAFALSPAQHTMPHPEPDPNMMYPSSGFDLGDRVFISEDHYFGAGILLQGSTGTVTEIRPTGTDLGDLLVVDFDNDPRDIGPVFGSRFELLEEAGSNSDLQLGDRVRVVALEEGDRSETVKLHEELTLTSGGPPHNVYQFSDSSGYEFPLYLWQVEKIAREFKVGDIVRVIDADGTDVYHIGDLVKVKVFEGPWVRVQRYGSEEQVFDPYQLEHSSPARESRHPMAAEADRIMETGDPMLIACEYAADEDMEAIVSGHTGLFDQGDPVVVWIDVNLGTQPLSADDADEFNSLVQDLKSFGQEA